MLRSRSLRAFSLYGAARPRISHKATFCVKTESYVKPLVNALHSEDDLTAEAYGSASDYMLDEIHVVHSITQSWMDIADQLHDTMHLPWWATIIGVSAVLRLACLPLTAIKRQTEMKQQDLDHQMEDARSQIEDADAQTKKILKEQFDAKIKELYQMSGIKTWKKWGSTAAYVSAIVPFFVSISSMMKENHGLSTGGTLWFVDLTAPDPYCGLSISVFLVMQINNYFHYSNIPSLSAPQVMSLGGKVIFSTFFAYWTSYRSAGIVLLILSSTFNSLVLEYALSKQTFRQWIGVPDEKKSVAEPLKLADKITLLVKEQKKAIQEETNPLYLKLAQEREEEVKRYVESQEAKTAAIIAEQNKKLEELAKKPPFWRFSGEEKPASPEEIAVEALRDYNSKPIGPTKLNPNVQTRVHSKQIKRKNKNRNKVPNRGKAK